MSIEVYREILKKSDADDIEQGRGWYQTANKKVLALASASGYTPEQVAGVVAVLSPMVEWHLNFRSAERLCKSKGTAKYIPGFSRNREKAKKILKNPGTIMAYVKGPKVRAFYESLLNPSFEEPVIDTQMIAAFFKGTAYRDDLKIMGQAKKRLAPIREAIKELSTEHGWKVAETQAVIWTTFKRLNSKYANQLKLWNGVPNENR